MYYFFSFPGKFDLNLIREHLFPILIKRAEADKKQSKPNVIKKMKTYMVLETEWLRFLDMMLFLAPATSYANFLRSQQVVGAKSM